MGGGGGVNIPQRNLGQELSQLYKTGWPLQYKNYTKFWQNEPLLNESHNFALSNLENVGQLTSPLMALFGQVPGQLDNISASVSDLYKRTGALAPNLQNALKNLIGPGALSAPLLQRSKQFGNVFMNEILPTLNQGGGETPEQRRNAEQAARAAFAARGNLMGNQAAVAEVLDRDEARRARFNDALSQGLGISGEQRALQGGVGNIYAQNAATRLGLTQGLQGLYGAQGELQGLLSQILGQKAGLMTGLASGIQGLQGGALNQTLGVQNAQTGNYATLMNPLLSYASNLNESNQNAAGASSIAGANKSSGALGGGLSLLGSIAGGVGMAL